MTSNWDEYEESSSSEEEEMDYKTKNTDEPEYKLSKSQYDHVGVSLDNTPPEEINYKKNAILLEDVDKKLLMEYKHKISYLNSKILSQVLRGELNSATKLNYAFFLKERLKLKL